MTRRLGHEVYARLVEPLMSGIYAGDGRQLSLLATFPQMRQLERKYGSLLAGLQQSQPSQTTTENRPTYPPFVTLPTGMGALIDALADQLSQVDMRLETGVTHVQKNETGYKITLTDGTHCTTDQLILTTPAYVNSRLLQEMDPELAQAHAEIPYASSAIISLAYKVDEIAPEYVLNLSESVAETASSQLLDGYGYVIPGAEESDVLACTWTSSKWAGRAPEGYVLLRVYMGRYGRPDVLQLTDEQLVEKARTELANRLQIHATPHLQRIYRWPRAMPQYTLGHLGRLARIEATCHTIQDYM